MLSVYLAGRELGPTDPTGLCTGLVSWPDGLAHLLVPITLIGRTYEDVVGALQELMGPWSPTMIMACKVVITEHFGTADETIRPLRG